jgi:SAM (Sterile alpha motif) domain-containing protein
VPSIREWLSDIGLPQYAATFEREQIDFAALPHLADPSASRASASLSLRRYNTKSLN